MKTMIVAALLALALGVSAAPAADYRPPVGFNGHDWGTPLTGLRGLTLWRADAVLGFFGKTTDIRCESSPGGGPCSVVLSKIDEQMEGEGSHALAEYYFRLDNNPWHEQGVDVKAITYLFCASAGGKYLPHPLKKSLKLCGARVMFHSDTHEALATRGEGYVSNYDRILASLVADYGDPPGYEHRTSITVTSVDEAVTAADQARPLQERYRWCGLDDGDQKLAPRCAATVTLFFDAPTGEGTVLFATEPVYAFAYARHVTGDENNELYLLLEAPSAEHKFPKIKLVCTGIRICQASKDSMSAQQLREFQP